MAASVNLAVAGDVTVVLTGWVVTLGATAALTVKVTTLLVTLPAAVLETAKRPIMHFMLSETCQCRMGLRVCRGTQPLLLTWFVEMLFQRHMAAAIQDGRQDDAVGKPG